MASSTGSGSAGVLRDDPKDLGGRRLLLQGFGDLAVSCVSSSSEQSGVLYRDDRLSSEGIQERDLRR